jgi:hypothetical protein
MIRWISDFFESLLEHIAEILFVVVVVLLIIIVYASVRAIGEKDDSNLSYGISEDRNYAIVMDNAGNVKREGKIKRWCRASRYVTIDIEFEDGSIYTVSAENVILIGEEDLK